jgi:hypothetical protein
MVKKYFSSVICSKGYSCAYNTIYKKDPSAKIYIVNGDDYEKSIFFSEMAKHLSGYNITFFNPFYDESTDGIYIKNLNTYILSDGGYNKIYPVFPSIWEKQIDIVTDKNYQTDLLREILIHKSKENNYYCEACNTLQKASLIKERLHNELSPYLNEDKVINFIHRFKSKELKSVNTHSKGEIRLLSSPTPLGFHTHYETIFSLCEKVINIVDETSFIASIISGVIKNCAIREKIPTIASPSYFNNEFFQFLIFPTVKIGLCISDKSHILPFEPYETVTASRFLTSPDILNSRNVEILLSVEEKFLEKAILSIYNGRDERYKYNDLTKGYSNPDEAIGSAKKLAERILN